MADWAEPDTDELYTNVLQWLKDRDLDAAKLFAAAPTNPVTGMIRYNRSTNKFEEYNGATWVALVLSVAGGGTGAADAPTARNNLGLGSMAIQQANNVNITGGSIAGLTSFTIHCNMIPDVAMSLGSNANKIDKIYIATGAVAPVGTDKYLTS